MYRINSGSITAMLKKQAVVDHLMAAKMLIEETLALKMDADLKKRLLNNFSYAYYAVLIDTNRLDKADRKSVLKVLKEEEKFNCKK